MPAGDGRGPIGSGPMTGRGAGYCTGYSVPGYMNAARGGGSFGYGRGCRGGRGPGSGYFGGGRPFTGRRFQNSPYPYDYKYPQTEFSAETEAKMLKQQTEFMQKNIEILNERIRQLESLAAGKQEK